MTVDVITLGQLLSDSSRERIEPGDAGQSGDARRARTEWTA